MTQLELSRPDQQDLARNGAESIDEPATHPLFRAKSRLVASLTAAALLAIGVLTSKAAGVGAGEIPIWISLAIGMFYGGRAAVDAVVEREFNIDVLMIVGAALAAWVGHPAEGSLLLVLFVLSSALEELAASKTRRAVEALHKLMPEVALRLEGDEFVEVGPEQLIVEDLVKVRPGERFPTDGFVHDGVTQVDQASLTGESRPRDVAVEDEVFAGTVNIGSPVTMRVSRPVSDSSLQRILNLVMEAQQQRQPIQRLIDRVSEPYAWSVLLFSITVFLTWWLAFGDEPATAAFVAITFLIVASPCAIILATPTATLASIARGAMGWVLFKGGEAIERLARIDAIALDKTGTITSGTPVVTEVSAFGDADEATIMAVAAGLEADSTHPIATAITDYARHHNIKPAAISSAGSTTASGVSGTADGREARLGKIDFLDELLNTSMRASIDNKLDEVHEKGLIGVALAWNGAAAVIAMEDQLRPNAEHLVEQLHELGVKPVVMLTGDIEGTARRVAEQVGVDDWHAEMLPEDKVRMIRSIREEGDHLIAIVGDGLNDSPALAAADVSLAMGSVGTDAALESADIVLLRDDMSSIPWAIRLARRTRRTIIGNLIFAIGAMAIMAVATLIGSRIGKPLPMWMGVLGHEGGTLLVVANSLLLLTFRGPRR